MMHNKILASLAPLAVVLGLAACSSAPSAGGSSAASGPEAAAPAEDDDHPEFALRTRERREAVRRALDALPVEQREVVVLKEYEGLKFREIAEVLGVPESTVKSRMYFALDAMRDTLLPERPRP